MTREQLEKLHDEAVAYATKVKLEHGEHNDVAIARLLTDLYNLSYTLEVRLLYRLPSIYRKPNQGFEPKTFSIMDDPTSFGRNYHSNIPRPQRDNQYNTIRNLIMTLFAIMLVQGYKE